MTSYKVDSAEKNKILPATESRGELSVHEYVLDNGGEKLRVERLAKPETPLPAVGTTIDGNVEQSRWGLRFKPERFGGGNGGPRGRDPKETKAIQRQHSQEMALRFTAIKASLGTITDFTFDDVRSLTNAFEDDLLPTPPKSDVPADTEGLPELNTPPF